MQSCKQVSSASSRALTVLPALGAMRSHSAAPCWTLGACSVTCSGPQCSLISDQPAVQTPSELLESALRPFAAASKNPVLQAASSLFKSSLRDYHHNPMSYMSFRLARAYIFPGVQRHWSWTPGPLDKVATVLVSTQVRHPSHSLTQQHFVSDTGGQQEDTRLQI